MFNNGIVNDDNYNHIEKNLKNVLNLANTNQNARAVEEEIYYNTAKNVGRNLNVTDYNSLSEKITALGIGQIVMTNMSDEKIVFRLDDCFTCSEMENIGKPVCYFEAGILAGAVSTISKQDMDAVEVRCNALGDNYCEFEVTKASAHKKSVNNDSDGGKTDINMLYLTINSLKLAKSKNQLLDKISALEEQIDEKSKTDKAEPVTLHDPKVLVASAEMIDLVNYIKKVAKTDASILMRGESGTGKTMFAEVVHQESPRSHQPFIYIDCTTIPKNFFETELFGYSPGAFTGASKKGKIGKLEMAQGGTVFLDEIAEIPIEVQSKLLRFLQEKKFEKMGAVKTQQVDTRVIAATSQNLEAMIGAGLFRKDLYYRLNVINIVLPPLRDRIQEIPGLVERILTQISRETGTAVKKVEAAGLRELMNYNWPGNIRELENLIKRLTFLVDDPVISRAAVEKELNTAAALNVFAGVAKNEIKENEKELIIRVLENCRDNKSAAAAKLGITRQTLYNKIKKYNITS